METDILKKILLYSGVAVVLGLLLTLVPLIALADLRAENQHSASYFSQAKTGDTEVTYGGDTQTFSVYGLDVLAISFAIALVVYVLFKRRISHDEYRWIKGDPY
jgi:hypothetical protein